MIRIVLDTDLFVSALLKPDSNPDIILHLVKDEKVLLLMSDSICHEISRVLTYPKIRKRLTVSDEELKNFVQLLGTVAIITPGTLNLPPIDADPDDTKYLVCAVEGHADYIVSGDHHLTDLVMYRGIRIVTPVDFIQIVSTLSD
ncbi:MAG: putative toxin-antitoxin system toxin component, PIN family [Proteobacteria bacterium]|jgi:putative PIN family toxin of toxin-antitoxin system|nr:putative toxin-antitoxin system toxin component, PIN family [Desulfocapsa sp.]MBU3943841.1 putative toxin-antitoxin system toxin component, PIN family [Pseudomonadota bacterium]MCG2745789.1 putative toxin-antitoxin system toxin component, PIN family [Desulfobacteraceae bacterium]MBU3984419.1 putative toxin-antitoxin system toxin component, PIN family [Pseudomonadota bacterium]MBU4028010.1 putative toxin-antitoxin system toxin component, PIN family [Pseudomonadota bacterium]